MPIPKTAIVQSERYRDQLLSDIAVALKAISVVEDYQQYSYFYLEVGKRFRGWQFRDAATGEVVALDFDDKLVVTQGEAA